MQENKEPIKDEEIDKFVSKPVKEDFHEKLKNLIKETEHGRRVLLCSAVSNAVSLESLVKAYEKNIGYDFSNGTISLDEMSLEIAANPLYEVISKELGIEITSLSDKQLKEVVSLKSKNIANPGEYLKKVRQMYEEGTIADKPDKELDKKIKDTDAKFSENKSYIFTEKSIANAKEINDFFNIIVKAGGLSQEELNTVINETVLNIEQSNMSVDLKSKFFESYRKCNR